MQKVPILGDIPVLGFFFRNTTKQVQKTNIIIALTPYVIDDMDDLRRVADKKMRERREFIERFSANEDKARLEANIDYRRKRGMLEEINRSAREIDDEETGAAPDPASATCIDESDAPSSCPTEPAGVRPPAPRSQRDGPRRAPVSLRIRRRRQVAMPQRRLGEILVATREALRPRCWSRRWSPRRRRAGASARCW